jgi:hypothetical protein
MPREYLGHLSTHDPLFHFLRQDILPMLDCRPEQPEFRVFNMKSTKDVYLYEEKHSGTMVVGKFFAGNHMGKGSGCGHHMRRELKNLVLLRTYGLSCEPHQVVRPLGINPEINSVLVEEYVAGVSLGEVINGALYHGGRDRLFQKLSALAWFLATLHNRTASCRGVNFEQDGACLERYLEQLAVRGTMDRSDFQEFLSLRDRWRELPIMWQDRQVLVHGDATPSNFLFDQGSNVTAIDLERMKYADRAFDVGRIAGELQFSFIVASGNKRDAEPFIGHFLWEYCCHFPDRERTFSSVTARVPFHMALTLLRIARNNWVTADNRRRLVDEARITLRVP